MPDMANGFNPNLHASMDQVLPDALQEVMPGAMPEILPGMLPTGEMFMPQLLQPDAQQMLMNNGALPSVPANAMTAGMNLSPLSLYALIDPFQMRSRSTTVRFASGV